MNMKFVIADQRANMISKNKTGMRFKSFALATLFCGCCGLSITSEEVSYYGRILGVSDSTIRIYSDNGHRDPVPNSNGMKIMDSGYYIAGGTTPSHSECDHPNHWDNGPLVVVIKGDNIRDTQITFSEETLKTLPRISGESIGISESKDLLGIWKLPDIILTANDSTK